MIKINLFFLYSTNFNITLVTCKNSVIFSDKAFKLLLKTDIGRRYSALIISFLTKENLHTLENNLSLFSEEIALTKTGRIPQLLLNKLGINSAYFY